MITGGQIIYEVEEEKSIQIEPYDRSNVNPNSYNFHLGPSLLTYNVCQNRCSPDCPYYDESKLVIPGKIRDCASGMVSFIDPKKETPFTRFDIPAEGFILQPGILYLGSTIETTACNNYVACLDGRSSLARLGVKVHATAGFGDFGFKGRWTLEIEVAHPFMVYPGMSFGQFYFEELTGIRTMRYIGKYVDSNDVVPSRYYMETK